MKISFYLRTRKSFEPDKLWDTPFGGAEISAFNLGRELSKHHDVWFYGNASGNLDEENFHIRHYDQLNEEKHQIFICVRLDSVINPREIRFDDWPEMVLLWTGDAHDQKNNQMLLDPLVNKFLSLVVCKSNWQRKKLIENFALDPRKTMVMYNGVAEDYFAEPGKVNKNKFIHASVIFRGARHLLQIWPRIKARLPEAQLHIYSKLSLYGNWHPEEEAYRALYSQLGAMDGARLYSPIAQKELIGQFKSSYLMLYPNDFLESSCGVALETQAAGCPVITTRLAGLIETVGRDGILIDPSVGIEKYVDCFVENTLQLVDDEKARNALAESGRHKVLSQFTWEKVALRWEKLLSRFI